MVEVDVSSLHTPGNWLAHYTTADAAFGHIVPEKRLRLSPYSRMNDPIENKDLDFLGGWYGAGDDSAVMTRYTDAVQRINRLRAGVRIASLTADAPGPEGADDVFRCSWARPRMWHQYADAHRGVCLVFERERFVGVTRAGLNALGSYQSGEVIYTAAGIAGSRARTLVAVLDGDGDRASAESIAQFVTENEQDLFFLKTDDWSSEHGFRLLLDVASDEYAFVGYADTLAVVMLGERFPEWQIPGRWPCASVPESNSARSAGTSHVRGRFGF